jgi:hypothetical protein
MSFPDVPDPEPASFPEDSDVEVRFPLTPGQSAGDRAAWPWLPGWVIAQVGPDEWEIGVQAEELMVPDGVGDPTYPTCYRGSDELRARPPEPEAGL